VFYDGDCGFCNRTVQFILNSEIKPSLFFCALQSEMAKELFAYHHLPPPDMSTFYFYDQRFYSKSTAALRLASYLRFPYSLMRAGWLVPRFIRDWIYDGIAARRQKLAPGFCALPTPEQSQRFLR
jgi:predicted DCC family thiol-disulfide oxidoreductase YuxK